MKNRTTRDDLSAHLLAITLLTALAVAGSTLSSLGETVSAKHKQGSGHGFVLLKSADGKLLAVGDRLDRATGNMVRSRLVLSFVDGSVDDETAVFQQGQVFQLLKIHHIQKGPSFPELLDMAVDVLAGEVTWKETKGGKTEVKTEHMDLPVDLANGMLSAMLNNDSAGSEIKVPYLTIYSKPRILHLIIRPAGYESFQVGGSSRKALLFTIHINLGGVAGVVAPLIGKQPSDVKIWVTDDAVPTFLKMEGPLYPQGPLWTMVPTSPTWPGSAP